MARAPRRTGGRGTCRRGGRSGRTAQAPWCGSAGPRWSERAAAPLTSCAAGGAAGNEAQWWWSNKARRWTRVDWRAVVKVSEGSNLAQIRGVKSGAGQGRCRPRRAPPPSKWPNPTQNGENRPRMGQASHKMVKNCRTASVCRHVPAENARPLTPQAHLASPSDATSRPPPPLRCRPLCQVREHTLTILTSLAKA